MLIKLLLDEKRCPAQRQTPGARASAEAHWNFSLLLACPWDV